MGIGGREDLQESVDPGLAQAAVREVETRRIVVCETEAPRVDADHSLLRDFPLPALDSFLLGHSVLS